MHISPLESSRNKWVGEALKVVHKMCSACKIYGCSCIHLAAKGQISLTLVCCTSLASSLRGGIASALSDPRELQTLRCAGCHAIDDIIEFSHLLDWLSLVPSAFSIYLLRRRFRLVRAAILLRSFSYFELLFSR
ncbi:uncharacterized protein PV09_08365 [Verruconis gallopava]|uniref:Uncharacterized protein n=1 Tax=Verruconis gallopava TaxID=253628 RepID=A0A0D2A088_9PEZI|nr:uncharacterized protein PV09_08365 [Verruconis gallopava]KIW00013.1 hypothetical protein PV09_08365 [Verruconis gallopava]